MKGISDWLTSRIGLVPLNAKVAFLVSLLFGFIAHLYIFSNVFIYHDSAFSMMSSVGATFVSGRWGLAFLGMLTNALGIVSHSSAFDGFISILFIAISSTFVVKLLDIDSIIGAALTGALLVVFPTVASTLTYMFTAPYYYFSYLLAVISIYLVWQRPSLLRTLLSMLLIIFSLSIYQAYLNMALALAFSAVLVNLVYGDTSSKDLLKRVVAILAVLVIGTAIYVFSSKAIALYMNFQVTSYQGLDKVGEIDLKALPSAIFSCYEVFLKMKWGVRDLAGINDPMFFRILLIILSIIAVICVIRDTVLNRKSAPFLIIAILLICLTPFAMNSVYIMSTDEDYWVHDLMMSSLVIYLILLVSIFEHTDFSLRPQGKREHRYSVVSVIATVCLLAFPLHYWYEDNAAYYRMTLVQDEMSSWFTVLVSEIKATEGYRDDLPVTFIGAPGKEDISIFSYPTGNIGLTNLSHSVQGMISEYAWISNMSIHTGYSPQVVEDVSRIRKLETVESMPCYPDKGSIAVIDDMVVVKFNN